MDQIIKKWNYKQNLHQKAQWYRYFGEYIELVDLILEKTKQSQVTVISLPTLFLMRHTIELGYKTNLFFLEVPFKTSGKCAHMLNELHKKLETKVSSIILNYEATIKKEIMKRIKSLSKFKGIFDELDNFSYAFRYPVTTDMKIKSFKPNDSINIAKIIPAYELAINTLKYTTDVLDDYIENN
ncbi:MAG: hypothetical protein KJ736_08035 [Candidatus Omnitrophica bacterium]|nr:hypothetical protein [Candidatus Omnitrophota bacterium]